MKLGARGFKLITDFEKLRLKAYLDQVGIPTIGYGTTRLNGYPVSLGMEINELVADALFMGEANSTVDFLNTVIKVSVNQNQFDALLSLTYNIGKAAFSSSTLLRELNAKRPIRGDYFYRWNKVTINGKKVVSKGLERRRKAEYQLFTDEEL